MRNTVRVLPSTGIHDSRGAMPDLELQKRHSHACKHRQDVFSRKCAGSFRVIGPAPDGRRIRKSLKTSDWGRAARRLDDMEAELYGPDQQQKRKTVREAISKFHEQHASNAEETQRKYIRVLRF